MKTAHLVLPLMFTVFLVSLPSGAGEKTTYRHPELEFQFEAPAGWKAIPHAEDRLIYHLAAPDGGLEVMLWYTETTQTPPRYLKKMADMKGYQPLTEVRQEKQHRETVWTLQAVSITGKGDLRVLLAAIPSSAGLYIVQIWCPLERYEEERDRMESILASVDLVS